MERPLPGFRNKKIRDTKVLFGTTPDMGILQDKRAADGHRLPGSHAKVKFTLSATESVTDAFEPITAISKLPQLPNDPTVAGL